MDFPKKTLLLLLVLLTPLYLCAADDDDEEEEEKKSITYTKKKKKKKSSRSSKKRESTPSYASSGTSSGGGAFGLIILSPWISCDYLSREFSSSFFYDCSSEAKADRMEEATFSDDLTIEIAYGVEGASWQPGAEETEDQSGTGVANLLEYKTEGLVLQKTDVELAYLGKPLFTFSDERPLSPSKTQDELMEIKEDDSTNDYTRYTYGIQLLPLLEMFEIDSNFLNLIFSYRYRVDYEAFVGNATARTDMEYLKKDATFTSDGAYVTSGAVSIAEGENVSFKTLFEDVEHTVDITELWGPTLLPLRIGTFESTWERPSDNKRAVEIEGKPVIFDTSFQTKGYLIEFGPRYPSSDGFKMNLKYKEGTDNTIENAALEPLGIDFNEDYETLLYSESDVRIWYNYYMTPGLFEGDELFLSVGYGYNERIWSFEVKYDDGSTETSEADKDVIQKFYTQLKYRF